MFRKEFIKHQNEIWDNKVILLPSISPIYYILFSSIVFISIICFIIFGTYTRRINVTGEIVIKPYPIILESTKSGYIENVFVKKGQEVKEGDSLFVIADNKFTNDANDDIYSIELINLKQQIQHIKDYIINLDRQAKSLNLLLTNLQKLKNSYKILLKEKIVSKQDYSYQLMNFELRNQEYQNLLKDKQLAKVRLKELEAFILNKKYSKYTLIKSPINGTIESVDVTNKQSINIQRSLGSIKPIQKDLKIVFWLQNDAIPYINKGDKVKIRYFAFPFEKFGQFKGTVASVATIPASASEIALYKNNIDVHMNPKNPLYKVEVTIDKTFILIKSKKFDFFNGMQAQTTFFLEKRKIYQWIFSPLYYLLNS